MVQRMPPSHPLLALRNSAWEVQFHRISSLSLNICLCLSEMPSSEVASQFTSAATFCSRMAHPLWDLHTSDVLVQLDGEPRLVILDAFMAPDASLGRTPAKCFRMLPTVQILDLCVRNQEHRMSLDTAARTSSRPPANATQTKSCSLRPYLHPSTTISRLQAGS